MSYMEDFVPEFSLYMVICVCELVEKDTVLVSVFGVLLHPLQVLLVTLLTPRVVFDLRNHISLLQTVVQNLGLIIPITAETRRKGYYIYLCVTGIKLRMYIITYTVIQNSLMLTMAIYLI